jgi:hypothetical protein
MKINSWMTRLLSCAALFFSFITAHAGEPVWTFAPLTATTYSLLPVQNATIQYAITNQSKKTHTLQMNPIPELVQVTNSDSCGSQFTLAYHQTCILTLFVNGSTLTRQIAGGPVVCELGDQTQCYQPAPANSLNIMQTGATTLTANVTSMALSVKDTGLNAALTGNTRTITITNSGNALAYVLYNLVPVLPTGTTITPSSCGFMEPGATCVLTITPGTVASSANSFLSISGSNTNLLQININVLTYGSVYESGYVFTIDDTTPTNQSATGRVVAMADQQSPTSGIVWSANALGVFEGGDPIWGIDQSSTDALPSPNATTAQPNDATFVSGQLNCFGNTDGFCDTNNIYVFYSVPNRSPAIPLQVYAAGLCKQTIGAYSDWYLPSICEMGYDATGTAMTGCGLVGAPLQQNIQSSLVNNGNIGAISGDYWSATEDDENQQTNAFVQQFGVGTSEQATTSKGFAEGVRCVRKIT